MFLKRKKKNCQLKILHTAKNISQMKAKGFIFNMFKR